MKGIALHSVVPVRAEMREGAEQLTQMLFGETCFIMANGEGANGEGANGEGANGEGANGERANGEGANGEGRKAKGESGNWTRIRLDEDGQEGWVDTKMIAPMKEEEYASYRAAYASAATVAMPMAFAVSENNGQTIPLTAGTKLTNYQSPITNEANSARFEVLGVGFRIDPSMVSVQPSVLSLQTLLETTRFFLNVPYLWGGKNALGMDCSGFTQIIMGLFGKKLLRNAREQVTQGSEVKRLQDAQAGDLVFFNHQSPMSNDQSPITHVGLVIDPERVIHCSGRVKVEKLDEKGIYSAERGMYTHHLVSIRRV